jgi:hypothetical protein
MDSAKSGQSGWLERGKREPALAFSACVFLSGEVSRRAAMEQFAALGGSAKSC